MIPAALVLLTTGSGPRFLSLREFTATAPFPCLMVAAMTMVAVNLGMRRAVRHGTEEIYGSTPISVAARTGGHLLSVLWPATATAVILLVALAYAIIGHGGHGPFSFAELAVGPVLVLGAGVLAVLVTRLWPSVLVVPITFVPIIAVEMFAGVPQAMTSGVSRLAFWVPPESAPILPPRPAAVHLVYLLGLTALAAITAVFIDRRHRGLAGLAVVTLALIVATGVGQMASVGPSAWAKVDRRLADPDDGQVCRIRHGVQYCAFPDDVGLIPQWDGAVAGVRRAVPADRFPGDLAVSERVSMVSLEYVNASSRDRLAARLPHLDALKPVDDGRLHPSPAFAWERLSSLDLAAGAGARTVGLPLVPGPAGELCDATGQGRAVVALWLAGQSTGRAGQQLERLSKEGVVVLGDHRYVLFADSTVIYGGVAWGEPEVALAIALLQRPAAEVAAGLAREWTLLTDPMTTTEVLARALSLDAGARLAAPTGELPSPGPQADAIGRSGPCP